MPNNAIGSVLIIPDYVIKKMEAADEKLEKLQTSAINTAKSINASFDSMATGSKVFSAALDAIIAKLKTVETSSANASAAFNNMKGGNLANAAAQAEKLGASITRAAENVDKLTTATKDRQGDAGLKNISAALDSLWKKLKDTRIELELYWKYIATGEKNNVDFGQKGLNEAAKTADALMRQITALDTAYKQLRNSSANINNIKGQSIADIRQSDELKKMSAYYREMERSSAAQAKEAEKRAAAEEKAREREAKAAERAAKAQEKARQQQIKAQNSTYQGSLDFAGNATSINQRTQAIKYLQAARASLSTTDSEYASKLRLALHHRQRICLEAEHSQCPYQGT